jgi:hypothetical protein
MLQKSNQKHGSNHDPSSDLSGTSTVLLQSSEQTRWLTIVKFLVGVFASLGSFNYGYDVQNRENYGARLTLKQI